MNSLDWLVGVALGPWPGDGGISSDGVRLVTEHGERRVSGGSMVGTEDSALVVFEGVFCVPGLSFDKPHPIAGPGTVAVTEDSLVASGFQPRHGLDTALLSVGGLGFAAGIAAMLAAPEHPLPWLLGGTLGLAAILAIVTRPHVRHNVAHPVRFEFPLAFVGNASARGNLLTVIATGRDGVGAIAFRCASAAVLARHILDGLERTRTSGVVPVVVTPSSVSDTVAASDSAR